MAPFLRRTGLQPVTACSATRPPTGYKPVLHHHPKICANLRQSAVLLLLTTTLSHATPALLETHCADCHADGAAKGQFELTHLGTAPTSESLSHWITALDLVAAGEMPPAEKSDLTEAQRAELTTYLRHQLHTNPPNHTHRTAPPRRLNNREFTNSIRDALLLPEPDPGTHQPTANLLGDTLHHGFDTHGESLGFSRFHLEQFLEAARKIVDAAILDTDAERPQPKTYTIPPDRIASLRLNQNAKRPLRYGTKTHFDFLDPRPAAYFPDFETVPATGRYKIKIRTTGKDRLVYATEKTGFYHGDPIQLEVRMGDRVKAFDLPDEEVIELELDEWLAAGTRLKLAHPTDAFTLRGNGNFKFQNAIAGEYIKANDPEEYARRAEAVARGESKVNSRRAIASWHHWVDDWQGARPRLFGIEIEGPLYETWPPKRQVALLGENPTAAKAATILAPIAQRAWRRPLRDGELDDIIALVQIKAKTLGDIAALKEGIVALFVSPAFLLLEPNSDLRSPNSDPQDPNSDLPTSNSDRLATKLSIFLRSSIPTSDLRATVRAGNLATFEQIRDHLAEQFASGAAEPFLREFPIAWLELNDINFMAPDPDHYRFYHRKRISEDMVDEVLHFFRHMVAENRPITEFLTADYSFINADLAQVYGIEGAPQDSKFRKHTFTDGRRGGLLGMGAFLTLTADSLSTSPIHRAVYVMENFMGIHPTPPPPDVEITEPDVRQAKTIKEVLAAHTTDKTCASCHQTIDPYGYAFENFDPTGAWRDNYLINAIAEKKPTPAGSASLRLRVRPTTLPIDASATFRNGHAYRDITDFRQQLLTPANRDRFVRCFITKLLTYANGHEPTAADYLAVEAILEKSAENKYRIVESIAAILASRSFRGG